MRCMSFTSTAITLNAWKLCCTYWFWRQDENAVVIRMIKKFFLNCISSPHPTLPTCQSFLSEYTFRWFVCCFLRERERERSVYQLQSSNASVDKHCQVRQSVSQSVYSVSQSVYTGHNGQGQESVLWECLVAYLSVRLFTLATMDRHRRVSCGLLVSQNVSTGHNRQGCECLVTYLSVKMFPLAIMDRDVRVSCEPLVAYLSVKMFPLATMDRDVRVSCGLLVSQNVSTSHNGQRCEGVLWCLQQFLQTWLQTTPVGYMDTGTLQYN